MIRNRLWVVWTPRGEQTKRIISVHRASDAEERQYRTLFGCRAGRHARGESQTGWNRIEVMTEEEITAAIASDPDSAIPPEDWEDTIMGILDTVEPKKHVNFRLDMDAGRWFKAQGRGYQTKMNAVLRAYILAQWKKQQ